MSKPEELEKKLREMSFNHLQSLLPEVAKELKEAYPTFESFSVFIDHMLNLIIVVEINQVDISCIPLHFGSTESAQCRSAYLEMNLTGREFRDLRAALQKVPFLTFYNEDEFSANLLITPQGFQEL